MVRLSQSIVLCLFLGSPFAMGSDETVCNIHVDARFKDMELVDRDAVMDYLAATGNVKKGKGAAAALENLVMRILRTVREINERFKGDLAAYKENLAKKRRSGFNLAQVSKPLEGDVYDQFFSFLNEMIYPEGAPPILERTAVKKLTRKAMVRYFERVGAFESELENTDQFVDAMWALVSVIKNEFNGNVAEYRKSLPQNGSEVLENEVSDRFKNDFLTALETQNLLK